MKVFVHHDTTGDIRSVIAVDAPGRFGLMLTPKPGLLVSEVEGMKVKPGAVDVEALRKIAQSHKVATSNRCKLAKKD
jgi:hypothetical protein